MPENYKQLPNKYSSYFRLNNDSYVTWRVVYEVLESLHEYIYLVMSLTELWFLGVSAENLLRSVTYLYILSGV